MEKNSTKNSNKRKSKRSSCVVPVLGKQGGLFEQTKAVDISKAGIGFISTRKVPLNKEVRIELNLKEDEDPVFVIGRVKWVQVIPQSEHFRIGIHFENVLEGSRSRLHKYFRAC